MNAECLPFHISGMTFIANSVTNKEVRSFKLLGLFHSCMRWTLIDTMGVLYPDTLCLQS